MHIGLIGGIGPAATDYYYRGLVGHSSANNGALELTIAHADMSVLLRHLAVGDSQAQANVFERHIQQLAGAGAKLAAVTSIAGHFCFRELEAMSPLPLLSALTAMMQELDRRKLTRVGLLGSKIAMETGLYGVVAGMETLLPQGDDLDAVSDEYFTMAKTQRVTRAQRDLFFTVGSKLCSEQHADVVILAGTDMFLAFADQDPGFDVIDSADVHIRALAQIADQT